MSDVTSNVWVLLLHREEKRVVGEREKKWSSNTILDCSLRFSRFWPGSGRAWESMIIWNSGMKKITNLEKIELCPALIKSLSFAATAGRSERGRLLLCRLYGCRSLWLNGELTSCWCVTKIWLRPHEIWFSSSAIVVIFSFLWVINSNVNVKQKSYKPFFSEFIPL